MKSISPPASGNPMRILPRSCCVMADSSSSAALISLKIRWHRSKKTSPSEVKCTERVLRWKRRTASRSSRREMLLLTADAEIPFARPVAIKLLVCATFIFRWNMRSCQFPIWMPAPRTSHIFMRLMHAIRLQIRMTQQPLTMHYVSISSSIGSPNRLIVSSAKVHMDKDVRFSLIADCEQTDDANPTVAIRPQPAGSKSGGIRRSLPAPPVSAIGLMTRQRREATGCYQDVDVFYLR